MYNIVVKNRFKLRICLHYKLNCAHVQIKTGPQIKLLIQLVLSEILSHKIFTKQTSKNWYQSREICSNDNIIII